MPEGNSTERPDAAPVVVPLRRRHAVADPTAEGRVLSVMPTDVDPRLRDAEALYAVGSLDEAISLLHAVIHDAPSEPAAYRLRGHAFERRGYPEEAQRDYRFALALDPGEDATRDAEQGVRRQLELRYARCRALTRIGSFTVVRFLGVGWEGAVYHCRDDHDREFVVKRFHPHRIDRLNQPPRWFRRPVPADSEQLITLSQLLQRWPHRALYAFRPLYHEGRLVAIYYPFEPVWAVRRPLLPRADFSGALIGAALSIQAHLLRHAELLLSDLRCSQFMFNRRGHFRLVDYGGSLVRTTDHRCTEEYIHVVTLMRLLQEIMNPSQRATFRHLLARSHGDRDALAQAFAASGDLRAAMQRFPMLEAMRAHAAAGEFEVFMQPDFYALLAASLPLRPDGMTRWIAVNGGRAGRWRERLKALRSGGDAGPAWQRR